MPPALGAYLFLLGLASGVALLTTTGYRRVCPVWLRWLLLGNGLFVMSRYVTMALFAIARTPTQFWLLRHCWFASAVGLTLPSVFAVDQLLRHPAMTPKKLLVWFSPFLIVYIAVLVFGKMTAAPDRVAGWALHLGVGWQAVLSLAQSLFIIGFVAACAFLMRKVPSLPIRLALLGLVAGHVYLGLDGLILALGRWYVRPFVYSEMLTLLALWHAYETSANLQAG